MKTLELETDVAAGGCSPGPHCSTFIMDTRIAKERRTARKKVIEAIRNHWCIGNGWNREQWVDWLKDQGMISPRTNARDCRTVTNTIAQLRMTPDCNRDAMAGFAPTACSGAVSEG